MTTPDDARRRRFRAAVIGAVLLGGALVAPGAASKPMHVGELRAISDDEYPAETFDCVEPTDNTRSEVEVHAVANPQNPDNLLAAWIQDFGRAVVVGRSTDGGKSWSVQAPNLLDLCSAMSAGESTSDFRAIDPWLSFGLTEEGGSIAYLNLIKRRDSFPNGTSEVLVLTSRDDGRTWSEPRVITSRGRDPEDAPDKNSITAAPTQPCKAYAIWALGGKARGRIRNSVELAVTSDCGETWSSPRSILANGDSHAAIGSLVLVLPHSKTLLHVFARWHIDSARADLVGLGLIPPRIMVQRSEDDGATWSEPVQVGSGSHTYTVGDPDGGSIQAPVLPTAAVAPDGTAYVAWHDGDSPGSVLLVKSTDGGKNWTDPARVVTVDNGVFTPTLAVSSDGTVGITYYDFRNDEPSKDLDPSDEPLTADVWFAHADEGRTDTWEEIHVAGPFDMRTAPRNNGILPWLGEYQGLTASRGGFAAVFAMSSGPGLTTDGKTDVFFAHPKPGLGRARETP